MTYPIHILTRADWRYLLAVNGAGAVIIFTVCTIAVLLN